MVITRYRVGRAKWIHGSPLRVEWLRMNRDTPVGVAVRVGEQGYAWMGWTPEQWRAWAAWVVPVLGGALGGGLVLLGRRAMAWRGRNW